MDLCEFQTGLLYLSTSRPDWATRWDLPQSNKQTNKSKPNTFEFLFFRQLRICKRPTILDALIFFCILAARIGFNFITITYLGEFLLLDLGLFLLFIYLFWLFKTNLAFCRLVQWLTNISFLCTVSENDTQPSCSVSQITDTEFYKPIVLQMHQCQAAQMISFGAGSLPAPCPNYFIVLFLFTVPHWLGVAWEGQIQGKVETTCGRSLLESEHFGSGGRSIV